MAFNHATLTGYYRCLVALTPLHGLGLRYEKDGVLNTLNLKDLKGLVEAPEDEHHKRYQTHKSRDGSVVKALASRVRFPDPASYVG